MIMNLESHLKLPKPIILKEMIKDDYVFEEESKDPQCSSNESHIGEEEKSNLSQKVAVLLKNNTRSSLDDFIDKPAFFEVCETSPGNKTKDNDTQKSSKLRRADFCRICMVYSPAEELIKMCNGKHMGHKPCLRKLCIEYINRLRHPNKCFTSKCTKSLLTETLNNIADNSYEKSYVNFAHFDNFNATKKGKSIMWCNKCWSMVLKSTKGGKVRKCAKCTQIMYRVRALFHQEEDKDAGEEQPNMKKRIKSFVKVLFQQESTYKKLNNSVLSL